MFCNKCGNQVGNGAKFCPKCGMQFHTPENGAMEKTVKKTGGNRGIIPLILAGICIVMLVGIVALLNSDGAVVVGGIRYECYKDSKTAAILYPEKEVRGNLVIPATVKKGFHTYRVVSTLNGTFEECDALESVKLPDGMTSIGQAVFRGCSSLTSIELPDSITSIGHSTFSGCSSLKSIVLPDNMTSIESGLFNDCESLRSIKLPAGLTSIENGAFENCSSLTDIDLPEGLTSIGAGAFRDCTGLRDIELPEKLTVIDTNAFSGCISLTEIELPEGLTSFGATVFYECGCIVKVPATLIDKIPNMERLLSNCFWELVDTGNAGIENTDSDDYDRSDFESDRAYQEYSDFGDTSGLRK
ncbi:MAG: zinc-ribbon domain-containing protein [Lachnospiraceae bacterium]|nr:zinc-ribbon domain-containing protein [Lachnospiraceae bacterium]